MIKNRCDNIGRNVLYFYALGLYLFAKDLEISSAYHTVAIIPVFLEAIRYISYGLIVFISIFMTDYSYKVLKRYILFMVFFLIISLKAGSVTILFNFIFIFAAKNIQVRKMIKYVVTLQAILTICIFVSSLTGVIEDWTYMIAGRFRHSMGYGYPNAIPTIYFYTMLAICYLIRNKFKLMHVVVFEAINYLLFSYTKTRTAFAMTAIALFVFWLLKFRKKPLTSTKISRVFYVHSVYLIAIFSIMACFFYNPANPMLRKIDAFISNRLSMGHNALMVNHLTLFGQKIQWYGFGGVGYTIQEMGGEYNYVDCSYVKILLDYGIVMLLLAIIGYMFAANEELKKGNRYFCMALLFANLYAMIEPRYIETGLNPFVWCLSALISNEVFLSTKGEPRLKVRSILKSKRYYSNKQVLVCTISEKG